MARPKNTTPTYIPHKQTGRGRLQWYDALGIRHERLLPGPFNSLESLEAKARLELEIVTSATRTAGKQKEPISIAEVLAAFQDHAKQHYRREDGSKSNEVDEYHIVSLRVCELYGEIPAADFGPLALKAVRETFVKAGLSRKFINQRVGRIKHIFKWAVAEELVHPAVYHALKEVPGLQHGRTTARETEPVEPVEDAIVDATVPFLTRHVRGMVELQQLTGCRPGEACLIRLRGHRHERGDLVVPPTAAQDQVAREGPHCRHRPEGSGSAPRVLHAQPGRLPILTAAGRR